MDNEAENKVQLESNNIKQIFAQALQLNESKAESPLRRLTRKMINMEREYLFSEQGVPQRKARLKAFIEEARKSGEFNTITKKENL